MHKARHTALGVGLWLCTNLALWSAALGWPLQPMAGSAQVPLHSVLPLGRVHMHRFRLPLAGLRVEVIDLAYTRVLGDALDDADLIVNGGYWGFASSGRRTLIGLLSAAGREHSPLRHALDGGVLLVHRGRASIAPSRGYLGAKDADLAVQCRPRLLEQRTVITNLDARGHAARTAVCVRDAGATLDVYLSEPKELGPTLLELAQFLSADGCEDALNLDGGPSTAAAFRERDQVVRLGAGRELPYAIRFQMQGGHHSPPTP